MITLKGAEVSAKIKEQVLAMNGKLGGYVPTAAVLFLANLCQALFAFRSFTSIAMLASIPSASPETTEDAAAGFFFFDNVITHHPFSSLTFGFRIA